jgi:oxygen-independent coproporphyrinogen-3 oxidase
MVAVLNTESTESAEKALSLYIHIPYCGLKCPYCDFNSYVVSKIPEEEYCKALISEYQLLINKYDWPKKLNSIYFGGGTPSIFKAESIDYLIQNFSSHIDSNIEITIEINPGDINLEKLKQYKKSGINRLSFGTQSFNSQKLKTLGRTHTAEDAFRAVADGREAGFNNINLDLIFITPNETLEVLEEDLSTIINLNVEHVSAYTLSIEKGTPYYQRYHSKQLILPDEENAVLMLEQVNSRFKEAGLNRYEISNYAKNGYESRHNLAYWLGYSYLGLGAGAHSFFAENLDNNRYGVHWANLARPEQYITKASSNLDCTAWSETLDLKGGMFEMIFLGLRLTKGLNLSNFYNKFKVDLLKEYSSQVENFIKSNHLQIEDNYLSLTEEGFFLADSIIESFANDQKQNSDN